MNSQPTNPLLQTVSGMGSDLESIKRVFRQLLDTQVQEDDHESMDRASSFFVDELTRICLNWIATGRSTSLNEILALHSELLAPNHALMAPLLSLPPSTKLAMSFRALCRFIAVSLSTDNLAMIMGELVGKRREKWRAALKEIRKSPKPVTRADLCQIGIFQTPSNAAYATLRMEQLGLIEQLQTSDSAICYRLTGLGVEVEFSLHSQQSDLHAKDSVSATPVAPGQLRLAAAEQPIPNSTWFSREDAERVGIRHVPPIRMSK
jgi:hypothetical protein